MRHSLVEAVFTNCVRGVDKAVMLALAGKADHGGLVRMSLPELVHRSGWEARAVRNSLDSLKSRLLIRLIRPAAGRAPATYRICTILPP
jgi:hypothetical protein